MNIIFMSGTMIVFALLVFTNHKTKQKTKHKGVMMSIVWFVNAYLVFRNTLSVFDVEEMRPHYTTDNAWHCFVLGKVISNIKTIIVLFCCFEKKTYRSTLGWMLLVFYLVSLYAGTFGRENALKYILEDPRLFISELVLCVIQIRLFVKVINEMIETLQSKIE